MRNYLACLFGSFFLCSIFAGCGSESESSKEAKSKSADAPSTISTPTDYVSGVVRAGEQAKGSVELVSLQKAIDSFQQEENRFPSSLEELIQKSYLKIIPHAPVGQQFEYDSEKGTLKLAPKK